MSSINPKKTFFLILSKAHSAADIRRGSTLRSVGVGKLFLSYQCDQTARLGSIFGHLQR